MMKFIISVSLLFFSSSAFSANFCKTTNNDINIHFDNINIPPGTQIGDIVATSNMSQKVTECHGAPFPLVSYTDTSSNEPTGVFVKFPNIPAGEASTKDCEAMKSGFPGLGIAWVNFNTVTNLWSCASISNNGRVTRGLPNNGVATIYDQIILVKTGPIGNQSGQNEVFDFKKTFQFNERRDLASDSYLPDYGLLYRLTLSGNTLIQAPVCTASSISDSFTFDTEDAVNKAYTSSPNQVIEINCIGVIENGSLVPFNAISQHGIFSLDNTFFATSDFGVGVKVKYTENNNSTSHTLTPGDDIIVPITNNKSTINLKYTPYIKDASGTYPLDKNIQFYLELITDDNP